MDAGFYERYDFSEEHLNFLKEQYPVGSTIVSPKETYGKIIAFTHNGFLAYVARFQKNIEISFKQIGHYQIVKGVIA